MPLPGEFLGSSEVLIAKNVVAHESGEYYVEDVGREKQKSSLSSQNISGTPFEAGHVEVAGRLHETEHNSVNTERDKAYRIDQDPTMLLAEDTKRLAFHADQAGHFPHRPSQCDENRAHELYLDPTPKTPRLSTSPSRAHAHSETQEEICPAPEIQSIMDQFMEGEGRRSEDENSDSTLEEEASLRVPIKHPPRRSSLEPLRDGHKAELANVGEAPTVTAREALSGTAVTKPRISSLSMTASLGSGDSNLPTSLHSSISLPKELPLAPDPEPDLPFDFHRFLEQLRHRTADPVAKYLRSFLTEFGKKQWMAHEQVKFINDFLMFIANKMAQCEVWRGVSDAEFDNAKEGMEKLVMNRLYTQTFSPAIPPLNPLPGGRAKRKDTEKLVGSGRRGQHQEDVERDDILTQKNRIYGWVLEEHLDITPVGASGKRLLDLAQQGIWARIYSYEHG